MKNYLILSFITILFYSCSLVYNCVIFTHPEIHDKQLSIAYIGDSYYETISSEIENDPGDDNFEYYYDINSGLPPGLEYYQDYRTLIISGIPTETGSFTFKVELEVDPIYYDDEDEPLVKICKDHTDKTFTIIVE